MTWPRVSTVVLALLLAGVISCGVPEDDSPQELSAEEVPFGLLTTPSTTTTTPVEPPLDRQAELYFLDAADQVAPVTREVADRSPSIVLRTLLATGGDATPAGFSSAIPPDTALLDAFREDEVLTVDLSEEFTGIEGERSIAAVAQIVFTATNLPGVSAVAFRVEGDVLPVSDEDGAQQPVPVTPNDYMSLLAP